MQNIFCRTEMTFGKEAMEKLASCHVAIFGVGGVGGYVVEAIARSGVGKITVVDNDTVSCVHNGGKGHYCNTRCTDARTASVNRIAGHKAESAVASVSLVLVKG